MWPLAGWCSPGFKRWGGPMKARSGALACVVCMSCGGHSPAPQKASATIGRLGGVVQIPGGPALNIVADALSAETVITIESRASGVAGALSTASHNGPADLPLVRAATLSIPVD